MIAPVAPQIIRPQLGPQEQFLASDADVVIYGGAAGGGKSYGILLEPLRHVFTVPGFGGKIFRQTSTQITEEGAIWHEAHRLYVPLGGRPREDNLSFKFPPYGNSISFGHLNHAKERYEHQGAQICYLAFDELTLVGRGAGPTREAEEQRAEATWWYMLSRNRSVCGVRPYCRGTVNPDRRSWVKRLIAWWISTETGLPIPERAGVVRWLYRRKGKLLWYDTFGEAVMANPDLAAKGPPKSFTFIPARLEDNPALVARDPGYAGNLLLQDPVEGERLLDGNWNSRDIEPGVSIFTVTGSLEDDAMPPHRASLIYDEGDPRWTTKETPSWGPLSGPAMTRRSLVTIGAWDFGTGPSMLVNLLAMVELPPASRASQLPRIWLDDELTWHAAHWAVAAFDSRERVKANGYGRRLVDGGDPTGKNREGDQESWESHLRHGGIPLFCLPDWYNTEAGREWTIKRVQHMLDSDLLRIHVRCRHVLEMLRDWKRDLPKAAIPGLDLERIKPRHDQHSHPGMALLYLVGLVLGSYKQWMGGPDAEDEAPLRGPNSPPLRVEGSLRDKMRGFRI